jgi:hypothetical protein
MPHSLKILFLILSSALALTAQVSVTIASTPTGRSFSVTGQGCNGGQYTAPQTLSWTAGSPCVVSFNSPASPSTGTQYVFTGWQDGPTANPRTITAPAQAATYTANFTTQYYVTAVGSPAQGGTVNGGGFYSSGSTAALTAVPATGYRVLDWTNPMQPLTSLATGGSLNVTASAPQTLLVNFVPLLGGTPPGNYSSTLLAASAVASASQPYSRDINNYGQVILTIPQGAGSSGSLWTPVGPNAPAGSLIGLGGFPGPLAGTIPTSLNDYGQVIGTSQSVDFLWTPTALNGTTGSLIGLGAPAGSEAFALNNYGEVGDTGFLWTPATPNGPAGTSTTQYQDFLQKINGFGQAIFDSAHPAPAPPTLFTPSAPHGLTGTITNIPGIPSTSNYLTDLNDYGTIVGLNCATGTLDTTCGGTQTFLWIPASANAATGSTTVLPLPSGFNSMTPSLLDAFGQIFGTLTANDGSLQGFLWTPASANTATGTLTAIPLPAGTGEFFPYAINSSGQVVGILVVNGSLIPFLYSGGTLYDLSLLGAQFNRGIPADLNSKGQIVMASAYQPSGASAVYLLTPFLAPWPLSANPQSGNTATQTMTFTFTDQRGWQDLGVVNVLINNFIDGRSACYLAYSVPQSTLYLVNDAGTPQGPYAGSIALGGAGTIQNSQCTVALVSASGSGDNLTLTLTLTFTQAFAGRKILYIAARDASQNNSGWIPLGVWQVPGAAQTTTTAIAGISPASGAGLSPTPFAFTFSDTKGSADLGVTNILINTALDGRHACYLAYARSINWLYLVNDAGTALLPGASLTSSGSVNNSQCAVSWGNNAVTASGNNLALALNIGFSPGFGPNLILYLAARDVNEANNTGWQSVAIWIAQ